MCYSDQNSYLQCWGSTWLHKVKTDKHKKNNTYIIRTIHRTITLEELTFAEVLPRENVDLTITLHRGSCRSEKEWEDEKGLSPAPHAVISCRGFHMTDVKNEKKIERKRRTRLTICHTLPESCAFSPTLCLPDSHTLEQKREQKTGNKAAAEGGARN